MNDYFLKNKIGGYVNSKIDNQDSVATIYSVECLSKPDIFSFNIAISDFCISCEENDDIEIMDENYHIFIQVKSAAVSGEEFKKILASFLANDQTEKSKQSFFVLTVFEPIKFNGLIFTDRFQAYKKVLKNRHESNERKAEIKESIIKEFKLTGYESIIDRLYIDNRPLFRDIEDTRAIFARYLRTAYGFKDHGETRIDFLFNELCDKFAELRRNRDNIDKAEIEKILGEELCKSSWYSGMSLSLGYTKIESGYIKNTKLLAEKEKLQSGAQYVVKKIMSGWRRYYFKEFLLSMIIGAKRCPQCGHPMMANIMGLNGIACPDCGYNPYITLILYCECGAFEVVKRQPELDEDSIFNYLNNFFRGRKDTGCKVCGKELLDDNVELRTMLLPVPIPYTEYKNIDDIYENSQY